MHIDPMSKEGKVLLKDLIVNPLDIVKISTAQNC